MIRVCSICADWGRPCAACDPPPILTHICRERHPPSCHVCGILGVVCTMIKERIEWERLPPTQRLIVLVLSGQSRFPLPLMIETARKLTAQGHTVRKGIR